MATTPKTENHDVMLQQPRAHSIGITGQSSDTSLSCNANSNQIPNKHTNENTAKG